MVRCTRCGVVFPDPMPLPRKVSELYAVEPDSYWPPAYFRTDPGYLTPLYAVERELLGPLEGLRALDVGAGIGKGVVAMRHHGFLATGLEPSATFRALALERMGLAEHEIILSSVEEAELPSATYDYVNFGAVLEHLPDPRGAIERSLGWLRPGGILHAEVPHAGWLLARGLNLWYRASGQGMVTNTSPMHPPYHLVEFTERAFHLVAEDLPCRVERTEVWVADVLAPRLLKGGLRALMRATGTGMQLAVWLRRT